MWRCAPACRDDDERSSSAFPGAGVGARSTVTAVRRARFLHRSADRHRPVAAVERGRLCGVGLSAQHGRGAGRACAGRQSLPGRDHGRHRPTGRHGAAADRAGQHCDSGGAAVLLASPCHARRTGHVACRDPAPVDLGLDCGRGRRRVHAQQSGQRSGLGAGHQAGADQPAADGRSHQAMAAGAGRLCSRHCACLRRTAVPARVVRASAGGRAAVAGRGAQQPDLRPGA